MSYKSPTPEIIFSSLHVWKAISRPSITSTVRFGSLVTARTTDITTFGIVHQIQHEPSDTVHIPMPLGKSMKELERDHPTSFPFLQTTLHCLTCGYAEDGTIQYRWPPIPPAIHTLVHQATQDQYKQFFMRPAAIAMLLSLGSHIQHLDELLLALLAELERLQILSPTIIEQFFESFSLTTGNDYRRLKSFLQRAESSFSWHTI